VYVTLSLSLLPLYKEWYFHWDNASAPLATVLNNWFANTALSISGTLLVTRLCCGGLLLVLEGEGGADGPLPGQRQPRRDLGRGHHDHHC
jgi:hypothetical protein